MADEYHDDDIWEVENMDEEYEEISSDEVDRVVAALEELMAGVESENIRHHLEVASQEIFSLVYEADDEGNIAEAA